jgi:signal transduction histidine kinase
VSRGCPEVGCDEKDLDEILGNLIDNAFKWASDNVEVSASRMGRSVTITVDDDGR